MARKSPCTLYSVCVFAYVFIMCILNAWRGCTNVCVIGQKQDHRIWKWFIFVLRDSSRIHKCVGCPLPPPDAQFNEMHMGSCCFPSSRWFMATPYINYAKSNNNNKNTMAESVIAVHSSFTSATNGVSYDRHCCDPSGGNICIYYYLFRHYSGMMSGNGLNLQTSAIHFLFWRSDQQKLYCRNIF